MMISDTLDLLWPPGQTRPRSVQAHFAEHGARDLGVDKLAKVLAIEPGLQSAMEELLLVLTAETDVIQYRQEILADLRARPKLVADLTDLLPLVFDLSQTHPRRYQREDPLHEVMRRLSELETIVSVVGELSRIFAATDGLKSAGLRHLASAVGTTAADETFQQLAKELPDLLETMRSAASLTVGINLNADLEPIEAVLLAVNSERYTDGGILEKLFGSRSGMSGIASLHGVPFTGQQGVVNGRPGDGNPQRINPRLVPLFRDLSDVMSRASKPIVKQLRQYAAVSGRVWSRLYVDFGFYLGAIRLIEQMEAVGLPMCRPEMVSAEIRETAIANNYNINLAIHLRESLPGASLADHIVGNDVAMGDDGRIFILTGPNQGGKTTYIQAVGLSQVLAQAGMWVPGTSARISPVDNVLTHYPIEEKLEKGTGRFGDEAQRLQAIFGEVTPRSLVLLNESLSSTAAGESHYLAVDVIRAFRIVGARVIFATHLHELAADSAEINATTPGSAKVVSLVASRIEGEGHDLTRRSYKIVPGQPMGRSYARELAERYGVSYEQLTILLRERGVGEGDGDSAEGDTASA